MTMHEAQCALIIRTMETNTRVFLLTGIEDDMHLVFDA